MFASFFSFCATRAPIPHIQHALFFFHAQTKVCAQRCPASNTKNKRERPHHEAKTQKQSTPLHSLLSHPGDRKAIDLRGQTASHPQPHTDTLASSRQCEGRAHIKQGGRSSLFLIYSFHPSPCAPHDGERALLRSSFFLLSLPVSPSSPQARTPIKQTRHTQPCPPTPHSPSSLSRALLQSLLPPAACPSHLPFLFKLRSACCVSHPLPLPPPFLPSSTTHIHRASKKEAMLEGGRQGSYSSARRKRRRRGSSSSGGVSGGVMKMASSFLC